MNEWHKKILTPLEQIEVGRVWDACINCDDVFKSFWRMMGVDPPPTQEIRWWTEPFTGNFVFCWR